MGEWQVMNNLPPTEFTSVCLSVVSCWQFAAVLLFSVRGTLDNRFLKNMSEEIIKYLFCLF